MAGADQQGADNADGFEGGAELGDRFGVAIGALGIDVEEGVAGLGVETDADQFVGVLPLGPQHTGAQGIVGDGAPLGFIAE